MLKCKHHLLKIQICFNKILLMHFNNFMLQIHVQLLHLYKILSHNKDVKHFLME